jgi:type II secretory pathway pseudopilin PulG
MVLVIIALLTSGLIISFSTQKDVSDVTDTERQLAAANEALLGFAAVHGRLPCPAPDGATGLESPAGGGPPCTTSFGFLPAVTLGITPTNPEGYAVDPWNNRIRYGVTVANASAFTSLNGIKGLWANPTTLAPDLHVCPSAASITNAGAANSACTGSTALTDKAVAVLVSNGKNGGVIPPLGADEIANVPDAAPVDRSFVARSPGPDYDDVVTWLSPNLLYNRMLAAGRLP